MPWQNIKNSLLVKVSSVACIISLIVFIFSLFATAPTQKEAKAASYNVDQILVAINKERSKKEVSPLILNDKLSKAAANKAEDMAKKNYFSHVSPVDGKKWSFFIKDANYDYTIAGENLANGFDSVSPMVKAWMESPAHRENILNKQFGESGIGIMYGKLNKNPTIFVVQVFGTQGEAEKFVENKDEQKDGIEQNKSQEAENSLQENNQSEDNQTEEEKNGENAEEKKEDKQENNENNQGSENGENKSRSLGEMMDLPVIEDPKAVK